MYEVEVNAVDETDGKVYDASAQLNEIFLELIESIEIREAASGRVVFQGSKDLALNFPTVLARLQVEATNAHRSIDNLVT